MGRKEVIDVVETPGGFSYLGQVIAVEQRGVERPFVSLDGLERIMAIDPSALQENLRVARVVFDRWHNRTGGVYVNKALI